MLISGIVFEERKRRQREIYIEKVVVELCDACMYDGYMCGTVIIMIMMDDHDGVGLCVLAV